MPVHKKVGYEFVDDAKVLLVYTSGDARFTDFGNPSELLNDDDRYRRYDELIFAQDISALGRGVNTIKAADSLGKLQGPDEHYKTAFVVKSDLDFGLARQFNSRRGRSQGSMQVYRDVQSALDFIEVKDEALRAACVEKLEELAAAFQETLS